MDTRLLVLPVPQRVAFEAGECWLPEPLTVGPTGTAAYDATIRRELNARTARQARTAQVQFLPAAGAPADLAEFAADPEGYALVAAANGVSVWAAHPAGHLYAALTLRQVLRQCGHRIPCLRIGDKPKLRHRGAMLSFPQGHTAYRPALMRHLVPELARWKINALYLYLESYFEFPSLPHTAGPGAMTPDDAKELDRLCQAYNVMLIPQLNVMAHCGEILTLQKYHHLVECPPNQDFRTLPGFNLCATAPEVRTLVETMLTDLFACFSAPLIHVGGDEVSSLGECPRCQPHLTELGKPGLYLDYFGNVRDIAAKQGRKIGIWGDMLLHYYKDATPEDRKRVFAPLRENTVIYDWHYSGGSPDTLKFFVAEGFETIACSSTHLCYSSALWPGQAVNQRLLFGDAVAAGALGGMTTAWCNFTGLHEEHFNYLFASAGTVLWSSPGDKTLAPDLDLATFEKAYLLQRYGFTNDALTRYWHTLGDARGPVLSVLAPLHGVNPRKCLYHTDNVLTFWKHYAHLLCDDGLERYRAGVADARRIWEQIKTDTAAGVDPYLPYQEAPLLMHEHLLRRYEMTEAVYAAYDAAAKAQFEDTKLCTAKMNQAADRLLAHLDDFAPIEKYLAAARKEFGLDRSSQLRITATRRKMEELAAFLRSLATSDRPLPAFIQMHDVFLDVPRTNWYGDREHEWATGPARFQRYTLQSGPWTAAVANADREADQA